MSGKQAKVLNASQQKTVLAFLQSTRHPLRNKVIFLLSVKAGLRAKEIAKLRWGDVSNASGEMVDHLVIEDRRSKGKSGRTIPLHKDLRVSLSELRETCQWGSSGDPVIQTERCGGSSTSAQVIVNLFRNWYLTLGFAGASSHSGRRTFITNAARKISQVGGSLRDVQKLAGHSSLQTTQRYIEFDSAAQKKVVQLI